MKWYTVYRGSVTEGLSLSQLEFMSMLNSYWEFEDYFMKLDSGKVRHLSLTVSKLTFKRMLDEFNIH